MSGVISALTLTSLLVAVLAAFGLVRWGRSIMKVDEAGPQVRVLGA